MLALIDRTPEIYLDEIAEELFNLHGIIISVPTIYRTIKAAGLTHKKVYFLYSILHITHVSKLSKVAVERCEVKRTEYLLSIADEPVQNLVFVDECAINQVNTYQQNGWALKGQRARRQAHFVRGTRYVYHYQS